MKKLLFLISILIAGLLSANIVFADVERRMVVSADDVANWMVREAYQSGYRIDEIEAMRAAEVIVQLSRMEGGGSILTDPQMLTAQLENNGISTQTVIDVSVMAAQALQQTKLGGISVREILVMSPQVAIEQYPEIIGGEIMLRDSAIKLAEAQKIVEVLQQMIKNDPFVFNQHTANIKMKLIKEWEMRPAYADIVVKIIGSTDNKIEIVVPSNVSIGRRESETAKKRMEEAIRYLQGRGQMNDAADFRTRLMENDTEFRLSDIADKRGKTTVASPLELGIAVHFLETIHPYGADFVKEMAAEDRFGSMGLQQYIALVKKEMSYEWVNIVNKNALGHIALGDINKQIRKYENDLTKYAEFGGGKISIASLAKDYIRVGNREMPYDLVALMAKEPIDPEQLQMAFKARVPSLEPIQMEAIDALANYLPEGIRDVLNEGIDFINMKSYEIEEAIRDLEVFRVRAASVDNIEESRALLDEEQSFLVHMIVNRPKAVAWLSQVVNPFDPGDAKIIVNETIRKAVVEFTGIPALEFGYGEKINVLLPDKDGVTVKDFDEELAAGFALEGIKPVYFAGSEAELASLQEAAFMFPLYAELRKREAAKFHIPTLGSIEKALKTVDVITRQKGINLGHVNETVIPTQFEEIVLLSVSSETYEMLKKEQSVAAQKPDDDSKVYFFQEPDAFLYYQESRDIFGQWKKRMVDVAELQQRIYLSDALIIASADSLINRDTAYELFADENHFKYRNGLISFDDPYLTLPEKKNMLTAVDHLDAEMSAAFGIDKTEDSNTNAWKFLDGVRITEAYDNTATLLYIPQGFFENEKHVLEISSDLARNPPLIKVRLRDMTVEQAIQAATVEDTSSLASGILDSFDGVKKETTKDKIVKWAASKFKNRTEGSSLKGIRIKKMSMSDGNVFLNKEFPKEIKIGRLAEITRDIVNIEGADKIRKILSETAGVYSQ